MTPTDAVKHLAEAGWTEARIAEAVSASGVSCSQPTVNRIKTGRHRHASWEIGNALIQLAARELGRRAA